MPGGFVGVDVFFVISGFLVTEIIYSDILRDRFSFETFYRRRIRRIFPSLFLVLGFCFLAGWVALLADEFSLLAKHLLAGSLFSSNILLYSETGYFDAAADVKPLLHLWSLGIEEQFYLIWPVLIWAMCKMGRPHLYKALTAVFLISLAANLFVIDKNPSLTFYMLPTRLWELALGGLLALHRREESSVFKHLPAIKPILPYLGTILLLISFVVFNKATKFPGAWPYFPLWVRS
ncbi:MAG: acyltransferase [Bdellovibrionia bacterium]